MQLFLPDVSVAKAFPLRRRIVQRIFRDFPIWNMLISGIRMENVPVVLTTGGILVGTEIFSRCFIYSRNSDSWNTLLYLQKDTHINMGVSKNRGVYPQIIPCLIGVFPYFHHPFWGFSNPPMFGFNTHMPLPWHLPHLLWMVVRGDPPWGSGFQGGITKNFRYLKWRVSWTLFQAILGVGFPLSRIHTAFSWWVPPF